VECEQVNIKATFVTTEHQDINQSRRFLNQPSIAPLKTSSVINQIRGETQPNIMHHRSASHYQCSVPGSSKPERLSTIDETRFSRILIEYQPNPVKLPTSLTSSNKVQPNQSMLRSCTSVLRQGPHSQTKRQKGFNRIQQKQLRRLVRFLFTLDSGRASNKRSKGFNRIQQKQLRRLVWFFSVLDCGSVSFSYIYLGN
jgi:hypothetical protein